MEDKNKPREYVEAVPGPAIVISKETYKKMQENNNSKQNKERLQKLSKFFKKIKDETKSTKSDERAL